jgi:hypothetical protein
MPELVSERSGLIRNLQNYRAEHKMPKQENAHNCTKMNLDAAQDKRISAARRSNSTDP